jgi:hypothetical protein
MHPPAYCFFQAINCAERARHETDEKSRQFLRHLEDSWIAAARADHDRHDHPAEVIRLRRPIKIAVL